MAELTPSLKSKSTSFAGADTKLLILEVAIGSSEDVVTINPADYNISSVKAATAIISNGADANLAFIVAHASGNAVRIYTYEDDGSTPASDFTNASGVLNVYCEL